MAEATQAPLATKAAWLREALGLWRGPALDEFAYEPFAQAAIAELEELRLAALEERVEADLALGRHAELVAELEGLVAEHPCGSGCARSSCWRCTGAGARWTPWSCTG